MRPPYSIRNAALFGILQTPRWRSNLPSPDRKKPAFTFRLTTRDLGLEFLEVVDALGLRELRFHHGDVW